MTERLAQVLDHLGIERAHFAAAIPADVADLALEHPERVASLTLLCPPRLDRSLRGLGSRLLVLAGDQGPPAEVARHAMAGLPEAALVWLREYFGTLWADATVDRGAEIEAALLDFLRPFDPPPADGGPSQGSAAGITYRCQGEGPPLVLLPLGLAPSQWDPLLPRLAERYRVVTLGGPDLGMVALLESRGRSAGYLEIVRRTVEAIGLEPGETVLDVGCGSGVLGRWLARRTERCNAILGVDVNRYLLREAAALARQEELDHVLVFQEGNARALPLRDGQFDVAVSWTVLEEGDADRMLAEMVRVTRPGGRVAVMVRALDLPWAVSLPLRPELKAKAEIPRGSVEANGCADATLYRRFRQAGLTGIQMLPQLAVYPEPDSPIGQFWQAAILGALTAEEAEEWHACLSRAVEEGTYFIAQGHHCAVGTKR